MTKKCKHPYCKKKACKKQCYCSAHVAQRHRAKHPIKFAFDTLKNNAKRRGKEFSITLEYFKELILPAGYMEGKGRLKDCLSIDRIKQELGYIPGNLEVITNEENGRRYREFINNRKVEQGDIITNVEVDF